MTRVKQRDGSSVLTNTNEPSLLRVYIISDRRAVPLSFLKHLPFRFSIRFVPRLVTVSVCLLPVGAVRMYERLYILFAPEVCKSSFPLLQAVPVGEH